MSEPADLGSEVGSGDLTALEARLGYRFEERGLLVRALTHRSFANETEGEIRDNQRLEFLGDAVLGLVIATELFRRDADVDEGALSSRQSQLVCEAALSQVARQLELGAYLRLGRGEELSGGRQKASLLADAWEAVLAAVYLDGGLSAVEPVVRRLHEGALGEARRTSAPSDYKSRLQTRVQGELHVQPRYEIIGESGPAHAKVFKARVVIDGQPCGEGEGASKKSAEQQAAQRALEVLVAGECEE